MPCPPCGVAMGHGALFWAKNSYRRSAAVWKYAACTHADWLVVKLVQKLMEFVKCVWGVWATTTGWLSELCGLGLAGQFGWTFFPALQVFWGMEYKEKRARSALLGLSVDALLLVGRVRQCLDPTVFFGRLCCYKSVCNFGVWIGKISPD